MTLERCLGTSGVWRIRWHQQHKAAKKGNTKKYFPEPCWAAEQPGSRAGFWEQKRDNDEDFKKPHLRKTN